MRCAWWAAPGAISPPRPVARRRARQAVLRPADPPLFDLIDIETHGVGLALSARQSENPVEPVHRRIGSLKPHHRAEIIVRGVDTVAPRQPRHHVGRTMPQAVARHQLSLIHISEPTRQAEISYAV